jgi:hypothetical protein
MCDEKYPANEMVAVLDAIDNLIAASWEGFDFYTDYLLACKKLISLHDGNLPLDKEAMMNALEKILCM